MPQTPAQLSPQTLPNTLPDTLPSTLHSVFFATASSHPHRRFLCEKRDGDWHCLTYSEAANEVRRVAAGLGEGGLGIKSGDRVVLASENRIDWVIAELAVMSLGGLVVPSYATSPAPAHLHIMDDSEAVLAITSQGTLAREVATAAKASKTCHGLLCFDACDWGEEFAPLKIHPWQTIKHPTPPPTQPSKPPPSATQTSKPPPTPTLKADSLACLIYTSGTGGAPKGVMLTHRAIQANVAGALAVVAEAGLTANKPLRFLSLLPLSHAYEHTAGLHLPIRLAAEIWYSGGVEHLAKNLREVKPNLMIAVPRLYDVLHQRIWQGLQTASHTRQKAFRLAVALGMKRLSGERLGVGEWLLYHTIGGLVRRQVSKRLGGQLRYFVSGGAALNPTIGQFFLALNVGILQGYGQTEAAPVIAVNRPHAIRISSVGQALKGVAVKFDSKGQILVKGESVMQGYWRNPKETKKVLQKNGWLATGDIGEADADGFITISGRQREIIVNSGGDNISPARIEALLEAAPAIAQVLVYGDKKPYLVAVVVASEDTNTSTNKKGVRQMVAGAVAQVNAGLAPHERVRQFILADEAFTIANGEMTPTLKVKRLAVVARYGKRLEGLYGQKT